jgi:hypothetical protein
MNIWKGILAAKKSVKFQKWFISILLSLWYILFLTYNWLIDYSVVKFCVSILTQYRCLLEGEEWFRVSFCWFSVQSSSFLASSFFWSLGFIYCVEFCVVSLCITILFLPSFFSQSRLLFAAYFSFFCWSGVSSVQSAPFKFSHNKLLAFNHRSEVLTAVILKSSVFWDITPCIPLKVNRRFGRMSPRSTWLKSKPKQQTSMKQAASKALRHADLLLSLLFNPEHGGDTSSETSIHIQRTTRLYVPEDRTL